MSHFTVLCVGDVEYNMAPFHEYEYDGIKDEFVQCFNITADKRKDYEEAKSKYKAKVEKYNESLANSKTEDLIGLENQFKKDTEYSFKGGTFKEYLEDYCGIRIINETDNVEDYDYTVAVDLGNDNFEVYHHTNPNNVYDWYTEGGRWNGLLLLKEKTNEGEDIFVNCAKKGEIDFEEMWAREEKSARERYRIVIAIMGKVPSVEHTWRSLVDKYYPQNDEEPTLTRDEAIDIYDHQLDVILWNEKKEKFKDYISWNTNVEDFACSEEDYVKKQSIHAFTFGIVKEREYYSRGDMGWWACVSNKKEPVSWDEEYKLLLDSVDDDELITVIDCHI